MTLRDESTACIAEALGSIRRIEDRHGISGATLETIRARLIELAARPELQALTPPEAGEAGVYYTLDESPEHGYGLYLNVIPAGGRAPPHRHGVWCVAAGLRGEEVNRFYRRDDAGEAPPTAHLRESGQAAVRPGTGMYMLDDDIHAVEVSEGAPVAHLHLYARPLGQFPQLEFYDLEAGTVRPAAPPTPVPFA